MKNAIRLQIVRKNGHLSLTVEITRYESAQETFLPIVCAVVEVGGYNLDFMFTIGLSETKNLNVCRVPPPPPRVNQKTPDIPDFSSDLCYLCYLPPFSRSDPFPPPPSTSRQGNWAMMACPLV